MFTWNATIKQIMIQESCGVLASYQWLLYVHPRLMVAFTCTCHMLWNICTAFPILPHLWLSEQLPGLMEWLLYFLNKVSIWMSIVQQPLFKWIFIYVCRLLRDNQAFNIKNSCKLILSIHPSIHRSIYLSACLSVCHSACVSVHPSIFLISSNSSSILWFRLLPIPTLYILWLHSSSVAHLVSSYTLFCN